MRTKVIKLTPNLAKSLVERCRVQRKMRPSTVARLASDIENDRWHLTHQGIAVIGNVRNGGVLVDGQHRCQAVANTGKTVQVLCTEYDEDESSGAVVWDDGLKRSIVDVADFAGVHGVTSIHAACARMMMNGVGKLWPQSPSKQEVLAFIDEHKDAISTAIKVKPGKGIHGIATGGVLGALGRAYYHVPRDRLHRAIEILRDGFAPDDSQLGDKTIQRLRNQLIGDLTTKRGGGSGVRTRQYCWTEKAISHAAAGEDMQIIRYVRQELFPLPGEEVDD